jgi:hypothetical protein
MNEKRNNWKQQAAEETAERIIARNILFADRERIREQLQIVNVRSKEYESLKKQEAENTAKLATL